MSTLKQMGIQQWRRRADSLSPAKPLAEPEAVSAPPDAEQQATSVNDAPAIESAAAEQSATTEQVTSLEQRASAEERAPADQRAPNERSAQAEHAPVETEPRETPPAVASEPAISWDSLKQALINPASCPSCGASQPMLGAGDQQAECVFIIATPSANDMQRQQLLSGRDGQLFDSMLAAMKLNREQVYLTSACKCVVTDDSGSMRSCVPLVHQQLALVKPKVIVAFGQQAAQWVIKSNEMLPALRAQAQKCHSTDIPVVVTHNLSQLLAQPGLKAEAWHDLKAAIRLLATEDLSNANQSV